MSATGPICDQCDVDVAFKQKGGYINVTADSSTTFELELPNIDDSWCGERTFTVHLSKSDGEEAVPAVQLLDITAGTINNDFATISMYQIGSNEEAHDLSNSMEG